MKRFHSVQQNYCYLVALALVLYDHSVLYHLKVISLPLKLREALTFDDEVRALYLFRLFRLFTLYAHAGGIDLGGVALYFLYDNMGNSAVFYAHHPISVLFE